MLEGRYRIDAPIARGGMSTVFRGVDTRLDRPVAIKVMDPRFASDPQFLARFEFEARSVAKLKHPSLVAVYDQGVDGEHPFLIMELVEGGTLRELLRERGPMPPHAVRAVAEPALGAVGVAHRAGLVHRDIKPENVLISDAGEVKIADFGLVRAVAAATTTSASVILGTAAYLSPEQVTSGTADARSDVYAFGILIFELLTGRVPFTGDTSLSVAYQRIENDVPPPSAFIDGVPPEFDALVARATAREPAHRFADAAEMAAELRGIAASLALPAYRVPAPRESAEHTSAGQRVATPPPPPPQQPQHTRVQTAARPVDHGTAMHQEPGLPQPQRYDPYEQQQSPYATDPRRQKHTVWLWVALVAVLTLLVGVGGWWFGAGRYEAVPAVAGLPTERAVAALTEAGFETEIRQKPSDTVPVGGVVGSDPSAGARVPKGSTVGVLVSSGRPRVPEASEGADIAAVNRAIRDAGLTPVDAGEAGSSAPKGTLARVEPAPGTVLPTGGQVKVFKSRGSTPVQVPDVSGRGTEEAASILEAAGLVITETREQFDPDTPGGKAIGTDPAPGTRLQSGDQVVLLVSNSVDIPWVVGKNVGAARAELQQLGLQVQVRQLTPSDSSVVIGQAPGVSANVEQGSTVTLTALP
ncbi:Stk1 family PASTA domain-containing Ser/Thr kinase [Nocardia sp. NPDC057353]|uniref:Stk1 family PASTA domain-containing Ser/Thr kinase n=1 Tax=Nocardia sp. NPDC057353 TaxID=3346104 RepID=UPI003636018C